MRGDTNQDIAEVSSPDPARSEDNLSVQVNMSNRGRSAARTLRLTSRTPSPSPWRTTPGPPSRSQTTDNSQSSAVSSQQDRAPAEHILGDLIARTDSSDNALADAHQGGVKRSREGESEEDEPRPKRDKLLDELAELEEELLGSSTSSNSGVADASGAHQQVQVSRAAADTGQPRTAANGLSSTIPIRSSTRGRPPRQAHGVEAAGAANAATRQGDATTDTKMLGNDGSERGDDPGT
ncbi:hypothetical protein OQA88_12848 [Cercophora sp. LCS_1]